MILMPLIRKAEIPLYNLSLRIVSGPGPDYTPQADSLALLEEGIYEVELIACNMAGSVATSEVCEVTITLLHDSTFIWNGGVGSWHVAARSLFSVPSSRGQAANCWPVARTARRGVVTQVAGDVWRYILPRQNNGLTF